MSQNRNKAKTDISSILGRWFRGTRAPLAEILGEKVKQARSQLDLGNFAQSQSLCEEVLRAAPGNVEALVLVADIAFRSGNYEDAIECLRDGIATNPGSADVHYKLGCLYEDSLDYAAAAEAYAAAIRSNPSLPKAHNNLGAVLQQMGRMDEALSSFDRAYALDSGLWIARYNIGQWHKVQGRILDSVGPFQDALLGRREGAANPLESPTQESSTTHAKLRHDIAQLNYLVNLGILSDDGRRAATVLEQALASIGLDVKPAIGRPLLQQVA